MSNHLDYYRKYTPDEITSRCMFCNCVTKQGTHVPEAVSHSVCTPCLPKLWEGLDVTIIEPAQAPVDIPADNLEAAQAAN